MTLAPTAPTTNGTFPVFTNAIIPGQPHLIYMSGLRSGTSPNGLVSDRRPANATNRYAFNDAGTSLVPYDAGQYSQISNTRSVLGGQGRPIFDQQTLMPDVDRDIVYTHFEYDLKPGLLFTTDFSYGARVQNTRLSARDHYDGAAPFAFGAEALPLDQSEVNYALHVGVEHRFNSVFSVFGRAARGLNRAEDDEPVDHHRGDRLSERLLLLFLGFDQVFEHGPPPFGARNLSRAHCTERGPKMTKRLQVS